MRYAPMLAGLALAACGSSTAPSVSVAGNYTLKTIDRAPLPAFAGKDPTHDSTFVLNGSIYLYGAGFYSQNFEYQFGRLSNSETG